MSRDWRVALTCVAMGLSAVCDRGISGLYSLVTLMLLQVRVMPPPPSVDPNLFVYCH